MTRFTKTAVIKALEEIVEELGEDYVYPAMDGGICLYSYEGKPSCIAGRVFAKLDPEFFEKVAEAERAYGASFTVERMPTPDGKVASKIFPVLDATRAGRKALRAAQRAQDIRKRYGTALKDAKRSRA